MRWSVRVARIGETEIKVHASMLLLAVYVWLAFGLHTLTQVLFTLLLLALLFVCVFLHELGHTLVARHYGIPVRNIILWPLGGLAMLSHQPDQPLHELLIAAAGPLVNVVLAALALLGTLALNMLFVALLRAHVASLLALGYLRVILNYMLVANLSLVLFNLIPAYPLDGGRILRAILALTVGERRARPVMVGLSWALAFGLGAYATYTREWPLLLVAALVFLGASTLHKQFEPRFNSLYGMLFDRGLSAIHKGDYATAIASYDRAIARNPRRAMAYNNRGVACQRTHRYAQALADFSRALELKPDLILALSNRQYVYYVLGEYELGLADAQRWMQLQPSHGQAHASCALFMFLNGDDAGSLARFAHAQELAPYNAQILIGRSALHLNSGDVASALADCESALKLDPQAAGAHVNRGLAWLLSGEEQRALLDAERAIQLAPDLAAAYQNRGLCYQRAGEYRKALLEYDRAAALDRYDPETNYLRGAVYHELGDHEHAREAAELALKERPKAAPLLRDVWLTLFVQGRLAWAVFFYTRAAQLRPDDPLIHRGWGEAYRIHGEHELALAQYDRAIELAPARGEAFLARGRAHQQRGARAQAIADFQRVLELQSTPNARRQAEAYLQALVSETIICQES